MSNLVSISKGQAKRMAKRNYGETVCKYKERTSKKTLQ
jgi:hypothetical protein